MSGLMASFLSEAAMLNALDRLRAAGFEEVETFSPIPVLDLKQDRRSSLIPAGVFAGGVLGAAFMLGLEVLSTATDWGYPVNIGGRPKFSWPAYIPIAFAFGLLTAAAAGLLLFVLLMPAWRLWDPVDEFSELRAVSRDRWVIQVHAGEPRELLRASLILAPLKPLAVSTESAELEEVPA